MSQRRVVITGLGAVTPIGNDVKTYWDSLLAGKSGIDKITAFDATGYYCQIAGEVKNFDPASAFKNPKDVRRNDRYAQLGLAAAKEAIHDANIRLDQNPGLNPERIGVIIGSGIGGLKTLEDQHSVLMTKGADRLSAFTIPMMISNMASGLVSLEYGYQGPNFSIVTACATSTNCMGEAWRTIRDNDADVIVAGGCEAAVLPLGIGGFSAMKAVSSRNDAPQKASRPFDKDRDGFLLGEGSAVVILEELEHAKKRGAKIYAEVVGYACTNDAHHITSPAPQGAGGARAMKLALQRAGLRPDEISYINAHGTSTPQGDICETQGIKSIFGEYAKKVMVSSTKSMTGHLLGAAGAVEMIACVKAIETGNVPPTINLDNPDPECDLDYVPHTARKANVTVTMNNSFGFGGHNACIIARKLV